MVSVASKPSTAGGKTKRNNFKQTATVEESDGYFDFNDRDKLLNELKRASADISPRRHLRDTLSHMTSKVN